MDSPVDPETRQILEFCLEDDYPQRSIVETRSGNRFDPEARELSQKDEAEDAKHGMNKKRDGHSRKFSSPDRFVLERATQFRSCFAVRATSLQARAAMIPPKISKGNSGACVTVCVREEMSVKYWSVRIVNVVTKNDRTCK